MKIVRPSFKVMDRDLLKSSLTRIEYAARISHRSEDGQDWERTRDFIQKVVMDRADWSVTEHVSFSVEFVMDRGITHELVRHRIASYTQESTRFVNYEKKMPPSFIYPKTDISCENCLSGNEPEYQDEGPYSYAWIHKLNKKDKSDIFCAYNSHWLQSISNAEMNYKKLLDLGWRPQEARSVLPTGLAAKIMMTANLRSWRHFFLMRTTKQTHPQMLELSIPLLKEIKELIPVLYDDIEPMQSQAHNARLGQ